MTTETPTGGTQIGRRLRLPGEVGRKPQVLIAFMAAHVVNDYTATSLPAFLPAIEEEFNLSYLRLGVLTFAFTIMTGLVQPFIGNYADRNGRRLAVLVFGFVSTGVGFALMGAAPIYLLVVLSSLLCGLGGSTYHPQATAFLVRSYPSERGRTLGLHGWGGSIGHFLAPAVAAIAITAFGWRSAIALMALPSLIAAFAMRKTLTESKPNPGATLRGAASRDLVLMALTFGLLGMVMRGFLSFLPLFLTERGRSVTQAGVITTVVLVVGMFAQPIGGSVFDRLGGRRVFLGAAAGAALGTAIFAATTGWVALAGVMLMAFFVFALFPVSLAMASEIAGADRTGAAAGIVFGISGLTGAAVPPIIGAIADATDLRRALSLLVIPAFAALAMSLMLPNKIEQPD